MVAEEPASVPGGIYASKAVFFIFLIAAVSHGSFIALSQATDTPLIDDWRFVSELADIGNGGSAVDYLFARHNLHPVLPARAAFLLSLKLADLDLRLIRYGTYGVALACFALLVSLSAMAWRAVGRTESDNTPIFQALIALIALTVFSANHWETYSLAMGIAAMTCTTAVVASIFCGSVWLCRGGRGWLLLALVSGVIASLSMTQGMFVWSSLACLFVLGAEPRRVRLGIICLGIQAAFLVWNYAAYGDAASTPKTLRPATLLQAMPMLVATPFYGMINNAFQPAISGSGGLVLSGLVLLGLLSYWRTSRQDLKAAAPFLSLLLYGIFTIGLVSIGRQDFPVETMASSRYAAMTMPFLIGGFGCACIAARTSRLGVCVVGGIFAVGLVGWLIAAQQEAAMVKYRREAQMEMRRFLQTTPVADLVGPEAQQKLYIDTGTLKAVQEAITFLRSRKLSIFGGQRVSEPERIADPLTAPEMAP